MARISTRDGPPPVVISPILRDLRVSRVSCRLLTPSGLAAVGDRLRWAVCRAIAGEPEAFEFLASLGSKEDYRATTLLADSAFSRSLSTRLNVCRALRASGDRAAVQILIDFLKNDERPEVGVAACNALSKLGNRAAVEPLIRTLKCESTLGEVRVAAVRALGKLGDPSAFGILVEKLQDRYSPDEVRGAACAALADAQDRRALEPLLECLAEWDSSRLKAVCEALERLGESRIAWAFYRALTKRDNRFDDLAHVAAQGDRRAFQLLVGRAYISWSWERSSWIKEAFQVIGEGRIGTALIAVLEDEPEGRMELARLAREGDDRVWGLLTAMLSRREIQRQGIKALGALRDHRVFDTLVEQLTGGGWAEAIEALGDLGDIRAVGPLLKKSWCRGTQEALCALARSLESQSDKFLCGSCLARVEKDEEKPWPFRCRICGQSEHLLAGVGMVIAVLDEEWEGHESREADVLRVNWLRRGGLFDFDSVEITRAGDRTVERLCIVAGNDTDR